MKPRRGITGRGYALPPTLRYNDDPVFDWLNKYDPKWSTYFNGYATRHVLAQGEHLIDLMDAAATQALAAAGLAAADVDLLLGYASVSRYIMPNELAHLHQRLGLSQTCWVLPINNEYSNFNAGLVFADALIASGKARNALVVCGGNWSRHVSYHSSPAASAADGAGAAVLQNTADATAFRVVDFETLTDTSKSWSHMRMSIDHVGTPTVLSPPAQGGPLPAPGVYTQPYFHIDNDGLNEFSSFGVLGPIDVTNTLLERNVLPASQVTIICHQTSRYLLDHWNSEIKPHKLIDTLSTFANMTVASIPVNLAYAYDQIETDYLVLLGIGPELHANAVLLRRNG